jgi:molybdenum cofactor biosynthesis enzyme MoaA
MARSRNPDLLFEDVLAERAQRVGAQWRAGALDREPPVLDRATVFVTHRCNLRCRYCNGPHLCKTLPAELRKEMLAADLPLRTYERLLDDWAARGLRHVHFTGGEATLHPCLPEFVRRATRRGIPSSLTTNGTAPLDLYRELVRGGLSEVRISIDSGDEAEFDRFVGVAGAFRKVHGTITGLMALKRAEGLEFFVILNACVGSFNEARIRATLEALIGLAPDDIKLLAVAEEASSLSAAARRGAVSELLVMAEAGRKGFELLPRKISALYRRGSFGMKDEASRRAFGGCFVPLTERTLDGRGFFPCSIYLRYAGAPVAGIGSTFAQQQAGIAGFVRGHACGSDSICVNNCSACCREFNLRVSQAGREEAALREARLEPPIEVGPVARGEVEEALGTRDLLRSRPAGKGRPFMVVKPPGMGHLDEIRAHLRGQGVAIQGEATLPRWQAAALFLHLRDATGEEAAYRIARNKAYARLEGEGPAQVLWLEKGVPEGKLRRIKRELRAWYGEEYRRFRHDGGEHLLHTNCVHAPEFSDLEVETRIIEYFL